MINDNFKSRFLQGNILLYCVILLLILKVGTILIFINFPQNIFFADITKFALENSVNQTRRALGLNSLLASAKLSHAAQLKAENMVQNNYFEHTSPSGVTPWFWFVKAGYSYKYAGENLAIGFFESEEVFNAWLNSPTHRANIVNPNYTEVGTAVVKGFSGNNTIVVVQEFGSPSVKKNTVTAPTSTNTEPIKPVINQLDPPRLAGEAGVLSQSTQVESSLAAKAVNAVVYNYDKLLENIIYGVSLIVIAALLTLIFFNLDFKFEKQLVFRAVLLVVLLSAAVLINKDAITSLIPHQIII